MVSRNTRSLRNNQNSTPSETNGSANMIESETIAAGAETNTDSPNGRTSATKVKLPKKKTSKVWDHYTKIFVEETVDDMVTKKPMAACKYCVDVLCASSKQDQNDVSSILDELPSDDYINDEVQQDEDSKISGQSGIP
ncbi:uncharacterized protein [Zea mays]|uniref:uncharacterized protein n=1 Tax=Zea mays TaxID=4577 RepID=UPI0009A977BF|nr:uncharacterized protein LOC103638746 [Zea mays]|eukprot:XP_020400252.1 uncharacterized protein LOC103638746 [Zea mays]